MEVSQMFTFINDYITDFILCSDGSDLSDFRRTSTEFITCYWQTYGKWDASNTDICNAFEVKCQYILFC